MVLWYAKWISCFIFIFIGFVFKWGVDYDLLLLLSFTSWIKTHSVWTQQGFAALSPCQEFLCHLYYTYTRFKAVFKISLSAHVGLLQWSLLLFCCDETQRGVETKSRENPWKTNPQSRLQLCRVCRGLSRPGVKGQSSDKCGVLPAARGLWIQVRRSFFRARWPPSRRSVLWQTQVSRCSSDGSRARRTRASISKVVGQQAKRGRGGFWQRQVRLKSGGLGVEIKIRFDCNTAGMKCSGKWRLGPGNEACGRPGNRALGKRRTCTDSLLAPVWYAAAGMSVAGGVRWGSP